MSVGAEIDNRQGWGIQARINGLITSRSQAYFGTAGLNFRW